MSALTPDIPSPTAQVLFVGSETSESAELLALRDAMIAQLASKEQLRFELLSRLPALALPKGHFNLILIGYPQPVVGMIDPSFWARLLLAAAPGASFALRVSRESSETLEKEIRAAGWTQIVPVAQEGGRIQAIGAKAPAYAVGASSKLSLKKRSTAGPPRKVWAKAAASELIDEDDLLDDDDRARPSASSLARPDDCSTKKKACKNCSCGRAEEEDMQGRALGLADVVDATVTSSCGNCYLGDAFRCGSCPYLGLPAFKAGETVALGGSMLADDLP